VIHVLVGRVIRLSLTRVSSRALEDVALHVIHLVVSLVDNVLQIKAAHGA